MHILQGEALDRRMDEVLDFVGAFFVNKSSVHLAAEDLARRLQESGIEYAIAGGLSLGVHGFVRARKASSSREPLDAFKERWLGRGYVNLRAGGKPVRDTAHNVRIDFLIAGDFPVNRSRSRFQSPRRRQLSARSIMSSRYQCCSS